jgi:hypothetical protein
MCEGGVERGLLHYFKKEAYHVLPKMREEKR